MEEKTADEIAAIFSAAGDSVSVINADANFAAFQASNPDITRTTESFTDIDAAITAGKKLY